MASFVYGLLTVAGGGKLLSYIVIVYLWGISIYPHTVGGTIIFPMRRNSINQMKEMNPIIKDRFDFMLECIRRLYNEEESQLLRILEKDKDFFNMFVDFKGHRFFLNDLVIDGYNKVNCWCGKTKFMETDFFKSLGNYISTIVKVDFYEKRNDRIKDFYENNKSSAANRK